MSKHTDLGKKGEELALDYLLSKKYSLIEKNYRFNKAEVDIIMQEGEELVFVEVKTRESDYLIDPRLLITTAKQKQIIKVADQFIKSREYDLEARFDVIIIVLNKENQIIEHLIDAFTPLL